MNRIALGVGMVLCVSGLCSAQQSGSVNELPKRESELTAEMARVRAQPGNQTGAQSGAQNGAEAHGQGQGERVEPNAEAPAGDDALFQEARESQQRRGGPLFRYNEPGHMGDLKVSLLQLGFVRTCADEPAASFRNRFPRSAADNSLRFTACVKIENTSGGRFAPVTQLQRLTSRTELTRCYAMDNWGNSVTELLEPDLTEFQPLDLDQFVPGGRLTSDGILPPGSSCIVSAEMHTPAFYRASKYFLFYFPVVVSTEPLQIYRVGFFVPASKIVTPAPGDVLYGTREHFERQERQMNDANAERRNAADRPLPDADPAKAPAHK